MGHAKLTKTDYRAQWPDFLRTADKAAGPAPQDDHPTLIHMESKGSEDLLKTLLSSVTPASVIDNYDEQLAELFISENAQLYRASRDIQQNSIAEMLEHHYDGTPAWQKGSWIYYPWSGKLLHVLARDLFNSLRTIRNKDLITDAEQAKYAELNVACFGMSVGSSAAISLALQGASSKLKIADGAVVSGSNLNRILASVSDIGQEKAIVVGRRIYEMNPYVELHRATEAVSTSTLDAYIDSPWPAQVLVDEIDDLEMKIRLRVAARKRRLPVLMATDLGDDVMLDVERFDLDPSRPLFHGLVGNIEEILDRKDMTQRQWLKYATGIIGTKNVPVQLQKSLLKIGTTLPTQPQLGGTAMAAGAVIAFAVRQLALGNPLKAGRTTVSLEKILVQGRNGLRHKLRHKAHSRILDGAMKKM